jgi:5-methylcytosine-specific restriction endonuclease McrA
MQRCQKCRDRSRSRVLAGGHGGGYCPECSRARDREKNPVLPRHCIGCGQEFIPKRRGQTRCKIGCSRVNFWTAPSRICVQCGKEFSSRNRQQCRCSRDCQAAFRSRPVSCSECGQPVARRDGQPRATHPACKEIRRERLIAERTAKAAAKTADRLARPARPCAWCQHPITGPGVNYCSPDCSRRAQTARKHLRRRGIRKAETISLSAIYARDHGRCQLCRRPISQRLAPPHPRSATLDHIVPIIRGGHHVPANVQLAHYGCNSAKGDRPAGEQLRLMG